MHCTNDLSSKTKNDPRITAGVVFFRDRNSIYLLKLPTATGGFTLIELLIVVAVISIILTLAIPTYSNYSIRTKISEALSFAESAKTAAASTCRKDRTITKLNNQLAGYDFPASEYVQNVVLGGACEAPIITISTRATGARPNPVLTIAGAYTDKPGQFTWTCVSSGLNLHVPETCRS